MITTDQIVGFTLPITGIILGYLIRKVKELEKQIIELNKKH